MLLVWPGAEFRALHTLLPVLSRDASCCHVQRSQAVSLFPEDAIDPILQYGLQLICIHVLQACLVPSLVASCRPQLARGLMQLFSVEQQKSQPLEAHAAAFSSVKVCGAAGQPGTSSKS